MPVNWGEIFFALHKHCGLNKWEIWEYTLPQITELMQAANRYIRFEVETRQMSLGMFGAPPEGGDRADSSEYVEATEDDILSLAKALGG